MNCRNLHSPEDKSLLYLRLCPAGKRVSRGRGSDIILLKLSLKITYQSVLVVCRSKYRIFSQKSGGSTRGLVER